MISRRAYFWSAVVLAALLFLGVNVFANNFFTTTRLDLTQSGQYTLSPGTRGIIAKLPEPVTLRFYFSKKNSADYPVTAAYARRVRDLLGEYQALSKGKIILEDVDPEPFTPEEDAANAANLKPAPTNNGASVYFGLEGRNSLDDKEVIPYFAPEREPELEYDITSLLYQLAHPGKPKLAVITSLPLTDAPGNPGQPMAVYADLQRSYDVTMLGPKFTDIPAGTNVLLVAHPQQITSVQMRNIELFVLHGGRALIFIDPLSELVQQEANPTAPPSSDFVPLLKGWGVDYSPSQVVLDRALAQRVRNPADPQAPSVPYPVWLHLAGDSFASTDPVTSSLEGVNVASVGALSPVKGATTHFEPLLLTSNQSAPFDRDVILKITDPGGLADQIVPTGKRYVIAARITGHAVFPGVTQGNINLIVVADTDIFDDRFWLRPDGQGGGTPIADNEGFILNALESLSGSDDLISLRMRGNTDRPFTVVRDMQAAAERQFSETLTNLRGRLAAAQAQFAQLQQGGGGSATALTPEQTADLAHVRREIAGTRTQMREVQLRLRGDIDRLGTLLAFLNVLLMPILVAAFAIVFGLLRRRRARMGRA